MNYRFIAVINWLPEFNEQTLKEKFNELRTANASNKITSRNSFGLPHRLWEYLCRVSEIDESLRWADLPLIKQNKLLKNICLQELKVEGKTTFKEEFVTAGG